MKVSSLFKYFPHISKNKFCAFAQFFFANDYSLLDSFCQIMNAGFGEENSSYAKQRLTELCNVFIK